MDYDRLWTELAGLREDMNAGFGRVDTELAELRGTMAEGFAFMHAGFARNDRYFEGQQKQHLELRGDVQELRGEVQELRSEVRELRSMLLALTARVDRLDERVAGVENELRAFRDWTSRELMDIRRELRLLREAAEERDELRREVDALDARVTRLEQHRDERPA